MEKLKRLQEQWNFRVRHQHLQEELGRARVTQISVHPRMHMQFAHPKTLRAPLGTRWLSEMALNRSYKPFRKLCECASPTLESGLPVNRIPIIDRNIVLLESKHR